MSKLIYILFIFLTITAPGFTQKPKTDFYGAYPSSYGTPAADTNQMLGMHYPKTAYAEKLLRKRTKLNYTPKERQVLIKFYAGKELTPTENLILKKALRKQQKRDKLIYKYMLDTLRRNTKINPQLSKYEKQLLDKEKDSSASLTLAEQKALRLVHRHQKNLQRIQKRQTLTSQDSSLLLKASSDSARLRLGEKIKLLQIKQKQKRIENLKLNRMANQGFPTPIKVSATQRILRKINILNPRNRPSSYLRKAHNLEKKYKLSQQERDAYNKMKSGYPLLSFKEKYLANKAYYKLEKYKQKKHKLDQKYFWSMQDKQVKKRHRQHLQQNTRHYRKSSIFRALQNLRQTLKRLLS